jgi:hypothetical protein
MVKFRPNLWTLRANVEVSSLENVRSPALMWISEPGVAPLSRAYPRLEECRPFRTLACVASRPNSACSKGIRDVSGTDPVEKAGPSKEDESLMSNGN